MSAGGGRRGAQCGWEPKQGEEKNTGSQRKEERWGRGKERGRGRERGRGSPGGAPGGVWGGGGPSTPAGGILQSEWLLVEQTLGAPQLPQERAASMPGGRLGSGACGAHAQGHRYYCEGAVHHAFPPARKPDGSRLLRPSPQHTSPRGTEHLSGHTLWPPLGSPHTSPPRGLSAVVER